MNTTDTIQELAGQAYKCFERKVRDNGERYYSIKVDDSPDWIMDIVRAGHGDMMPDDWRYETIMSALEQISESDDPEDAAYEWADAYVDVYTSALLSWLRSHLSRLSYCDQAMENELVTCDADMTARISAGQYEEAVEVYGLVLRALEDLT